VSDAITLTLRVVLNASVRVDVIRPDRLSGLSEREVAHLPITIGRQETQLGELFAIKGERSARITVSGSNRFLHGLGAGMPGGEIVIEGDAGDDAGLAMSGGVLRIVGNAGDRLGGALPGASKGMTGGEIIVSGSVGNEAGMRVRRGLIVIGRDTGADAARAMIAGSLIVLGACGAHPGRGNKRGSIIACGSIAVPATYLDACTYHPPHVRLTLTYLNRRYGLGIPQEAVGGRYRRYCGDAGEPGKGEILQLER
jgi:formylmethanofuran dehydrogenase subunit C